MWSVWIAVAMGADVQATLAELDDVRSLRLLDSVPDVPADAYVRAAAGEVVTGLVEVPGHKARKAWGIGILDTPIDRYWAAVNDDRSKVEWTKLEHLSLLRGEYCGAERTVFQYLGVPMLTDRWWVVEQRQNAPLSQRSEGRMREMTWKSIDGGDELFDAEAKSWADQGMRIPFTEGAWLLVDLGDGRTLVEYYAWSDPGGAVPARMASSFAAGGISDTLRSMSKLAAQGPTCFR